MSIMGEKEKKRLRISWLGAKNFLAKSRTRANNEQTQDSPSPNATSSLSFRSLQPDGNQQSSLLALSMIALAAQLALADGPVNREEYFAFRRIFPIPGMDGNSLHQLFSRACADTSDHRFHARHIRVSLPEESQLPDRLMLRLLTLAEADGAFSREEVHLLREIGEHLRIGPARFERLLRQHMMPDAMLDDPYRLLGALPGSTKVELRRAYHRSLQKHHPDRMVAAGFDPIFVRVASEKARILNTTYASLIRDYTAA